MTTTYDLLSVDYDAGAVLYDGAVEQFDGVVFSVQMAFGSDPLDTSPTWTDVTTFVRGFDINRGRNSEFTTYGPGTVSIALDNRDRRFDPEHTTGPYFGQLNPMVPVRVQATYSGVTYTMFYGFVQGWPTVYNQSNTDAVATVQAIDATRLLGNIPLAVSEYRRLVIDTGATNYFPLQNASTGTSVDVVGGLTLTGNIFNLPNAEDYVSDIPVGEPNVAYGRVNSATYVTTEPYSGPMRSISVVVDATAIRQLTPQSDGGFIILSNATNDGCDFVFTDTDIEIKYSNATDNRSLAFVAVYSGGWNRDRGNIVTITADLSTIRTYVNGTQVDSRALSVGTATIIPSPAQTIYARAFGSIGHFAIWDRTLTATEVNDLYLAALGYTTELSSARLDRVLDQAGWPSAWRDVETGVQPVGSYRPAALPVARYLAQLDGAEQGSLFVNREGEVEFRSRTTAESAQIVGLFDDAGVDLPFANVSVDAHTVDAIRNRVVGDFAVGSVTAIDSASVTAYGEASESLDLRLIDGPSDAQSIVDARLARAKDPRTRITRLDVNVRRDPAGLVPVVAALDLSDDVTVSLTPTGVGSALWRAVRVQGITHRVTPQSWDVSLYLAPGPVNTNGPLMILDDDTYGELDNNKLG